ncbi:hypothetical protein HPB51_011034 [Rhipicephalus microplus]|uniref:transketolase n=1 Tax=Rhipicephalus microplus TaxID=6941 RepID=A0A9J6DG54_RHIMP|nr:hypothetical protein HPB51_011034 [Rhipicephalus microplus]
MDAGIYQELRDIANKLRILCIRATNASNSGHPTSCCSMAEIMSVLFFKTMRYRLDAPRDPSSDRLILSKGHAAPILYAAWSEAGLYMLVYQTNIVPRIAKCFAFTVCSIVKGNIIIGTVHIAGPLTASGLAIYRTYCIIGDGESAEGSIWEALSFAGHYKLDNLVAIFDINRLGQSEPTAFQHQMEVYKTRLDSFGYVALTVVHCSIVFTTRAMTAPRRSLSTLPTAVLCKTYKGKGIAGIEDSENWHGKPLGDKAPAAIEALEKQMVSKGPWKLAPQRPEKEDAPPVNISNIRLSEPPNYKMGEKVGVAIGCGCRGRTVPFASTFAAFFTRAFDQLRMGAISQANIKCAGSHAGISIGEDGPSQMALEDLAMFRAIPNSVVFYPSDAVSCERACELAANYKGIVFIRTSRPNTAVIYPNDEHFEIGKSKVVLKSAEDKALLIGAGVTLYEALNAAETLKKQHIHVRVLDIFCLKPFDQKFIISNAKECGGRIVVVEDHYPEVQKTERRQKAESLTKGLCSKHSEADRLS